MNQLLPILEQFPSISLAEMKQVQLMNRVDTKYLLNKLQLEELLQALPRDFFVQSIDNLILAPYKTLYFDTPDAQMYLMHHNRKLNRQKIRTRCYRSSQTTFCEIKNKTNVGRTNKLRVSISPEQFNNLNASSDMMNFINEHARFQLSELVPQVENSFQRITLVNAQKTERITIDGNIYFKNHYTGKEFDISDLVIIEVKQDGNHNSDFKSLLLEHRIYRKRISKYCLGTILTNPSVKYNRFKPKLRYINNIVQLNTLIF